MISSETQWLLCHFLDPDEPEETGKRVPLDPDPVVRASRSLGFPGSQTFHLWNEGGIIYSDLVLPRILGVTAS